MSPIALCLSGLLLATTVPARAGEDLLAAQQHFDDYRYDQGALALQRAAQAGDRAARLRLGLMLLHGEALFGSEMPAQRGQAVGWLQLAAADGCEESRHVLAKIDARARLRGRAAN